MKTSSRTDFFIRAAGLLFLTVIVVGGLTLALHYFVTSHVAFGIDFYVFWLAGKEVFLAGGNPYSEMVTHQAQLAVYGRPAMPGENYMMFANPPFSLLFVLPAIWMSYPLAQAFWFAFSLTVLLLAAFIAFPRLPVWVIVTLPFMYPVVRGLVMGQYSPLLAAFLFLVYALVAGRYAGSVNRQLLAGFLLAWTTIKPQLTWLVILFFLVFAYRKKAWSVWWGFAGGLLGLAVVSFLLVPGWPGAWLAQMGSHAENRILQPGIVLWASWISPLPWVRWIGFLLMFLSIIIAGYIFSSWWKGRSPTILLLAVISLLTLIVHPLYLPPAQIILLLPLLVWISTIEVTSSRAGMLVWLLALVLPWLTFVLAFEGVEPYAISIVTPALYLFWVLWLYLRPVNDQPVKLAAELAG